MEANPQGHSSNPMRASSNETQAVKPRNNAHTIRASQAGEPTTFITSGPKSAYVVDVPESDDTNSARTNVEMYGKDNAQIEEEFQGNPEDADPATDHVSIRSRVGRSHWMRIDQTQYRYHQNKY